MAQHFPEPTQVREQVGRVLHSPTFTHSVRLSRFLAFVVEQALEGSPAGLKETTIAVEVFDRRPSYDPKIDPIVRVEARRLRRKLEKYYDHEGSADPIRITLPRGSYVPVFAGNHQASERLVQEMAPRPRRRTTTAVAAAAVLLALLSVSLLRLKRSPPAAARAVPLTALPGEETFPAFSPDGARLAFVWQGETRGNRDIYVKSVNGVAPLRLTTDPGDDLFPAWSPDGKNIAFVRRTPDNIASVMLMPAEGGPETKLADLVAFTYLSTLSWSPDGKTLALVDRPAPTEEEAFRIYLLPLESGRRKAITAPVAPSHGDFYPAFSPDGRQVAFARYTSHTPDSLDLYVQRLTADGAPADRSLRLTFDEAPIWGLAWAADGRSVIFSSARTGQSNLWRIQPESRDSLEIVPATLGARAITIAPHGDRLAYENESLDTNLYRLPLPAAAADAPQRFCSSSAHDKSPQPSPDGKKIAFVSWRSGASAIWTCDLETGAVAPAPSVSGALHMGLHWSPDGRQIAFEAARPVSDKQHQDWHIYVATLGGGAPRRIAEAAGGRRPNWSHDGRWIYFASGPSGDYNLWKAPAEGGARVQVTRHGGWEAFESPEGRFIYYAKLSQRGIWRVPVEGGEEEPVLTQKGAPGRWALAWEGLYLLEADPADVRIEFFRFADRRLARLATLPKGGVISWEPAFSVWPDGRSAAYALIEPPEGDILLMENFR